MTSRRVMAFSVFLSNVQKRVLETGCAPKLSCLIDTTIEKKSSSLRKT